MARINISIPDELKARMDAEDENWSEVAATARNCDEKGDRDYERRDWKTQSF